MFADLRNALQGSVLRTKKKPRKRGLRAGWGMSPLLGWRRSNVKRKGRAFCPGVTLGTSSTETEKS
jgi:hypothetical protein